MESQLIDPIMRVAFFLISVAMLFGCAKSREEKELHITENNISIRLEAAVFPIARQDLLASASGKIKELYVKYGDRVEKGQKIYTLDKALLKLDIKTKKIEIAALQQLKKRLRSSMHAASKKAAVDLAAIELQKVADLHARGYLQDFKFDTYKKNYINELKTQREKDAADLEKLQTLTASIKSRKVELEKLRYRLRHSDGYASIDGFVADIKVHKGEKVTEDQKICTIVDIDRVVVRAGFASGLLPFIYEEQIVDIDFITTPPYSITAPIKRIVPVIDPKFSSMTLEIEVENRNYILQEGTRALVTIPLSREGQERVKKYFMHNQGEKIVQIPSEI